MGVKGMIQSEVRERQFDLVSVMLAAYEGSCGNSPGPEVVSGGFYRGWLLLIWYADGHIFFGLLL